MPILKPILRSSHVHTGSHWLSAGVLPSQHLRSSADLEIFHSKPIAFTVRYRTFKNDKTDERWVKDDFSSADGEICCRGSKVISHSLNDYILGMCDDLNVEPFSQDQEASELTAGTRLWSLSCSINPADVRSSYRHITIGLPHSVTRWFSLVRQSRAWLCPRQGRIPLALTEDAIVLSFLRNDGLHLILLALSLGHVLTVLRSTENGYVSLKAQSDDSCENTVRLLACAAINFEIGIEAMMVQARHTVGQVSGLTSPVR